MVKKICILLAASLCGGCIAIYEHDWLANHKPRTSYTSPCIIYDRHGTVLATLTPYTKAPVSIDNVPACVVNAFLSIEDASFFSHYGLSWRSILRSMMFNIRHGRIMQGASTITQQVARLSYLTHKRTWDRKLKEALIALQLERTLTKKQIFEQYLNTIYFGHGIYGVQAACQRFWGKNVSEITVHHAATLAAIAKSAQHYSPLNNPQKTERRRNAVLRRMRDLSFITESEYKTSLLHPVIIQSLSPQNMIRRYVTEWICHWAERTFGAETVYTSNMAIHTTLDVTLQETAEAAFSQRIALLRALIQNNNINGGLLSITPNTGAIRVMIGGYNFTESEFNRAFSAHIPMGSTFKPIIYAAALQKGIPLTTIMIDEPIEVTTHSTHAWHPRNADHTFEGPMTLVRALNHSNNIIAIKLYHAVGAHFIKQLTHQCGITSTTLSNYPSFALGTAEVTVKENVAAFNIFANNGVYVTPYFIERVITHDTLLYQHKATQSRRVFPSSTAQMMNRALMPLMHTARQQIHQKKWFLGDCIGKTGSTNNATTLWFVGSTPELTTALYVGTDTNTPLNTSLVSSDATFPIWLAIHNKSSHPAARFYINPNLQRVTINGKTGKKTHITSEETLEILLPTHQNEA